VILTWTHGVVILPLCERSYILAIGGGCSGVLVVVITKGIAGLCLIPPRKVVVHTTLIYRREVGGTTTWWHESQDLQVSLG
jgi:hypothetical protein